MLPFDRPPLATIVDPFGLAPRAARTGGRLALSAADAAAAAAIRAGLVDRVADELVRRGLIERIADELVDRGAVEHVVDKLLTTPLPERLVAQVLASDELWLVVEEIAQSPAVTEAISHQSAGFADQVAQDVGERTRRADARLERAARRLLRRPPVVITPAAPQAP